MKRLLRKKTQAQVKADINLFSPSLKYSNNQCKKHNCERKKSRIGPSGKSVQEKITGPSYLITSVKIDVLNSISLIRKLFNS